VSAVAAFLCQDEAFGITAQDLTVAEGASWQRACCKDLVDIHPDASGCRDDGSPDLVGNGEEKALNGICRYRRCNRRRASLPSGASCDEAQRNAGLQQRNIPSFLGRVLNRELRRLIYAGD
jgi:hypothetical protein